MRAPVQAELQRELQERGLPKTGTKAVLAGRLHGALQEERQLLASEPEEAREELHRQYLEALARSVGGLQDAPGWLEQQISLSMWMC